MDSPLRQRGTAQGARRSDAQRLRPGPSLMPLASPALPSRAFEWLCQLAVDLADAGHPVVVIDATATERAGLPDGLLGALNDASVAHLGPACARGDWLVIPGRRGLQALQATARAGGADTALSRLFAPFANDVLVLLYAPAQDLVTLLAEAPARVLVPVIDQPQASIDAYGAVKLLHAAGLAPVLAPLASGGAQALQPLVTSVTDCAAKHLGLKLENWPAHTWGHRAQASAITSTADTGLHGYQGMARVASTSPLWS